MTQTLIDFVLEADVERAELIGEAETAADPLRIAEIQTRLADIDAHAAPARAARILSGLGFDEAHRSARCRIFRRLADARRARRGAVRGPDLLLLDEPTNYLDLEGVLGSSTI